MSDASFLKCPCQHCGGSIEFPADGVGFVIDCPHCGGKTRLLRAAEVPDAPPMPESSSVPEPEASPSPPPAAARPVKPLPEVSFEVQEPAPGGRRGLVVALVVLVLLGGTAGGAFYYFKIRGAGKAVASGTNAVVAISGGGNGTSDTNGGAFNAPVTPTKGKSLDDLKVGAPALEKAKAGSLVYVVGALKNESDHQRYGVRAEFELLDAAGRPVGKTSDYRDVVEPRREWRFRALVLTKKAVSARLIGVSEDP